MFYEDNFGFITENGFWRGRVKEEVIEVEGYGS